MPNNLVVKTAVYEGPLDLLLELIEKRKLLINDISLAAVTEEYIARVNAMTEMPVGDTAEFVTLAATLLLIKSRSLLPTLELSGEEEKDIKELQYRLAVYQLLKDAARGLGGVLRSPYLYDGELAQPEVLFVPDNTITLASMAQTAHALISGFPQALSLPKVAVKKIVSLEEMITKLASRVSAAMRISFREFAGVGRKEKSEIVVTFLALLELVKQGIIRATQEDEFGDITLESDSVSTPSYE